MEDRRPARSRVGEVAAVFLRLGFTAFGGPAAHVALIEDECVNRRKWLDRQHFLDLLAAVNFIPGPNSTELVIHLGLLRAGWRGLLAAGCCFILPAALIILPLGYIYVRYGQLPTMAGPLVGIRACMIAIIASACIRFTKTAIKDRFTLAVALLALVAAGVERAGIVRVAQPELVILALAALAGAMGSRGGRGGKTAEATEESGDFKPKAIMAVPLAAGPWLGSNLLALAVFFLKVGATLFGSGYVLVSYLEAGLVHERAWLTPHQLTDAIAVGQVTPGPLLTTATFVGFVLGHQWGGWGYAAVAAGVATVAIFLPSFIFVAMLSPLWPRLRAARWARGALDGMNAAVVALIVVVGFTLGMETLRHWLLAGVAVVSLAVLLMTRVNATWVIVASAGVGYLMA